MPVARLDDEDDYKMKFVDEDGDGFDDNLQGPDAIPQPLAEGQLSNQPEEPPTFEKVQPYEDVPNPTTLPGAMDANTQEVETLALKGMKEAKPLEERANRLATSERDLDNNANLNLLTSIGNDISIGLDGATQFKDRKMDNSAARQANTAYMDTRTAQQKAKQAVADRLRTRAESTKSQYLKERNDKNALTNTLNTTSKDRFNAPVDFQNKLDEITAKKGTAAAQAALSDPKSEVSVTLRKFAEETYGVNLPTTMSAARLKETMPFLDKKASRDSEAQTRADKLVEDKRRHAIDDQTRRDLATDRNRNFDLNKKGLEESKAARLGAEASAAAAKQKDKDELIHIDGYELKPGMRTRPEDAAKAKAAIGTLATFKDGIKQLKSMVKEDGTWEMGEKGNTMESLVTELRMQYKDLATLGALTGPDLALISQIIPAAGDKFWAMDTSMMAKLDEAIRSADVKIIKGLDSMGYRKPGGKGGPPADGPGSPTDQPSNKWSTQK